MTLDTIHAQSHETDEPQESPWADAGSGSAPPPATARPAVGPPPVSAPRPRAPRRRPRRMARGAAAVAVAMLAGAVGGVGGGYLAGMDSTPATVLSSPTVTAVSSSTDAGTVAAVAAAVAPSVVDIVVATPYGESEGTGIVLSSDGLILTNAHVVSTESSGPTRRAATSGTGTQITVTRSTGEQATATVVGTDTGADVAVLQVDGWTDLVPATLGSSEGLVVGDSVIAVGSPLGLESTVTSGIVSALHREVEIGDSEQGGPFQTQRSATLADAIQTDAAVNPGNSGGPLVDAEGRVVGMVTAMASVNGDSGSIGIAFAIPIEQAISVAQGLIGS